MSELDIDDDTLFSESVLARKARGNIVPRDTITIRALSSIGSFFLPPNNKTDPPDAT